MDAFTMCGIRQRMRPTPNNQFDSAAWRFGHEQETRCDILGGRFRGRGAGDVSAELWAGVLAGEPTCGICGAASPCVSTDHLRMGPQPAFCRRIPGMVHVRRRSGLVLVRKRGGVELGEGAINPAALPCRAKNPARFLWR